jgi:hypothetical protein
MMGRKMRETFTRALGMALGLGIAAGVMMAAADAEAPDLPACEHENSTNCVWDAQEQGNGEGESFVDVDGETFYAEPSTPEVVSAPEASVEEPEVVAPAPVENVTPEAQETPQAATPATPVDLMEPGNLKPGDYWLGELVGDVIVCPPGFEVSIDYTAQGTLWAACM